MQFDEYVRLRGAALVRLARLLTADRHLGEDLAQEVLARAFVRWNRIARDGPPEAYLRQSLVNASVSRWRRSRREVVAEVPDRHLPQDDPGPRVTERDAVWRLVRQLPPRQRAAVVLRFYEDLDDAAIANVLNCSPVTVRTQIMRALATLRDLVAASEPQARAGYRAAP